MQLAYYNNIVIAYCIFIDTAVVVVVVLSDNNHKTAMENPA